MVTCCPVDQGLKTLPDRGLILYEGDFERGRSGHTVGTNKPASAYAEPVARLLSIYAGIPRGACERNTQANSSAMITA